MDPAPPPGFWRGLIQGRDGLPDEGALGFLVALFVGTGLKIYSVICPAHPFSMSEYCGGVAALVCLYNASKGVMSKLGG